jgi:hypothetical protein
MVASLSGTLALLVGLAVMLLPLLAMELSRPRDSVWGAVVLLLGLTLVTSADRLTGSPMVAVLCGGLLIGRLSLEVLQLRWRVLTPDEQKRLLSVERWQTSLKELAATIARGVAAVAATSTTLAAALRRGGGAKPTTGKRWVRADSEATSSSGTEPDTSILPTAVVSSFAEVDQLLQAASGQAG